MDLFKKAKVVRLKTNDGKYLSACEDKKSVSLQTKRSMSNVNWSVECITTHNGEDKLQLWSCYHKTLQITSMKGTVRQMKNGKQSWFPGWDAILNSTSSSSSSSSSSNTSSSSGTTQANAFWLGTCKCFLEARDPLKLILESAVADGGKFYQLDWFVEVVESVLNDSLQTNPVHTQKNPLKGCQYSAPIKEYPSCNSNYYVVINYQVESSQLGLGRISYFNSGQNINGSGIQKNGDVNVKYKIATGQDININFK